MDRSLSLNASTIEDVLSTLEQINALANIAMGINFTEMKQAHTFNYFVTLSELASYAKKYLMDLQI